MEAIEALEEIARLRWERQEPALPSSGTYTTPTNKSVTPVEESSNPLKTFQFETVKVNAMGSITKRSNEQAKYLVEDLGKGVTLEMLQIPGGTFTGDTRDA